ncbi:MAG TPA: TonB family protein [Gemmatimonas sp.]|nr:TonB family protein [Gemmatimonas sp.]
MFDSLLESKPRVPTRLGGSVASTLVHALLIGCAVALTAHAKPAPDAEREHQTTFTKVDPPPLQAAPRDRPRDTPPSVRPSDLQAPPLGSPPLVAPIDIPDIVPASAIDEALARPGDLGLSAIGRGRPDGVVGGTGSVESRGPDGVFAREAVDRSVALLPGAASPRYPEMLRASGVQGAVMMEFVVDTMGRAEPGSLRVLQSDHPLFSDAVRTALIRMRFVPAEVAGRKVRQLVQQPFGFALDR